jgi:hypothetical protein
MSSTLRGNASSNASRSVIRCELPVQMLHSRPTLNAIIGSTSCPGIAHIRSMLVFHVVAGRSFRVLDLLKEEPEYPTVRFVALVSRCHTSFEV